MSENQRDRAIKLGQQRERARRDLETAVHDLLRAKHPNVTARIFYVPKQNAFGEDMPRYRLRLRRHETKRVSEAWLERDVDDATLGETAASLVREALHVVDAAPGQP